jgi:hypothetical protein
MMSPARADRIVGRGDDGRTETMSDSLTFSSPSNGSRLLLASAALMATAGLVGMVGVGIATMALVSMARRRISVMEVPPREIARKQWRQARAAVSAGAGAWRENAAA